MFNLLDLGFVGGMKSFVFLGEETPSFFQFYPSGTIILFFIVVNNDLKVGFVICGFHPRMLKGRL